MVDLLFKQGFWLGLEVGFALLNTVLFWLVIYFLFINKYTKMKYSLSTKTEEGKN